MYEGGGRGAGREWGFSGVMYEVTTDISEANGGWYMGEGWGGAMQRVV